MLATAVGPDGRSAVMAGGNDNEIHVWGLRTGKTRQRLGGVGGAIWAVGFSRDGREPTVYVGEDFIVSRP